MTRSKQLLGATSAIALVAFSANPAFAAGTTAGDTITNSVSVSYSVGNVAQTAATDTDEITIDRKIDVTVVAETVTTNVSPGQNNAVLTFEVTNLSNDTVDYQLSVAADASNPAGLSNIRIYLDADNDGALSADELAAGPITYLDDMAEDETRQVLVIGNIAVSASDAAEFDVVLTADARSLSGSAASPGAPLTTTPGANTAAIDTVLADGQGDTDAANAGDFSATGTYVVEAANVTVAKNSFVISDPVNGTNNPKAIPGAVIEYCIVVSNAADSALATDVVVTDILPVDVSYNSTFGIFLSGNATCASGTRGDTATPPTATITGNEIGATLGNLAESQARSVYFRVTIN